MKTCRSDRYRKWTDDTVEAAVRALSAKLGHFPSLLDCKDSGQSGLAQQISARGGFFILAEHMGIPRIRSRRSIRSQGVLDCIEACIRADLTLKATALESGAGHDTVIRSANILGFRRMYVTAEERAHIMARRGAVQRKEAA